MTWTVWRLHRNQAVFASAALAAVGAFLVVTGIHLAGEYHLALSTCAATRSCSTLPAELFQGDAWLWDLATVTIVVPALFGMFWGAPLVAKETEESTHKLAWMQTVPRRRWLAVNLGWIVLAAAVWGAAMSALVTWWLGPENALQMNRFHPGQFDIQGLVPVAYSIFAVSLGIAAGAWFRRVLPAVATTLGGFIAVRFVVEHFVRPHYVAPVTGSFPLGSEGGPAPIDGGWLLSRAIHDPAGHAGPFAPETIARACQTAGPRSKGFIDCLGRHGWRVAVSYQPAARFWPFQWYESALFVALAVVLLGVAAWRVLSTDA